MVRNMFFKRKRMPAHLISLHQAMVLGELYHAVIVKSGDTARNCHEVVELIALLEVAAAPELECVVEHCLSGMEPTGIWAVLSHQKRLLASPILAPGCPVRFIASGFPLCWRHYLNSRLSRCHCIGVGPVVLLDGLEGDTWSVLLLLRPERPQGDERVGSGMPSS